MSLSEFCTCQDLACPLNPHNHEKGCSLCIAKNLKLNEIPSCFFHKVNADKKPTGYTVLDFAKFVIENEKK